MQIVNAQERQKFISGVLPLRPKLVVLDTLATMTVGLDENDTGEMGKFTAACREIANSLGATVLVTHHPTKGDPNTYRGSYQLEGNFDAMIRVKRDDNGDIELHCAKQKDEDKFPDLRVSVQSVTLRGASGEQDAITSLVVTEGFELDPANPFNVLSRNEQLTLDAIMALGTPTFTTEQIIAAVSVKRGKDSKSSVKTNWLPKLLEHKFVERVDEGVYMLPMPLYPHRMQVVPTQAA